MVPRSRNFSESISLLGAIHLICLFNLLSFDLVLHHAICWKLKLCEISPSHSPTLSFLRSSISLHLYTTVLSYVYILSFTEWITLSSTHWIYTHTFSAMYLFHHLLPSLSHLWCTLLLCIYKHTKNSNIYGQSIIAMKEGKLFVHRCHTVLEGDTTLTPINDNALLICCRSNITNQLPGKIDEEISHIGRKRKWFHWYQY